MKSSGVNPIHNVRSDGNVLVDVILIGGGLCVRLIDYRAHHNQEFLISSKQSIEELPYSKGTRRFVSNGLKYCNVIARLLSLNDLGDDAVKINELLSKNANLNINSINKTTGLSEKRILSAFDELISKKLISRVGFQRYEVKDQFGHVRKLFDPEKNREFLE